MRQLHEVAEEIRLNEAARVEESKKSEVTVDRESGRIINPDKKFCARRSKLMVKSEDIRKKLDKLESAIINNYNFHE